MRGRSGTASWAGQDRREPERTANVARVLEPSSVADQVVAAAFVVLASKDEEVQPDAIQCWPFHILF